MSDKEKKALFKACAICFKKRLFVEDKHKDCIYCLYPDHKATDCKICRTFSTKTLRDREGRLLTWLQKLKSRKESASSDSDEASSTASSKWSLKRGRSSPSTSTGPPVKVLRSTSDRSGRPSPSESPHCGVKEREGLIPVVPVPRRRVLALLRCPLRRRSKRFLKNLLLSLLSKNLTGKSVRRRRRHHQVHRRLSKSSSPSQSVGIS